MGLFGLLRYLGHLFRLIRLFFGFFNGVFVTFFKFCSGTVQQAYLFVMGMVYALYEFFTSSIQTTTIFHVSARSGRFFIVWVVFPIVLYNVLVGLVFDFMNLSLKYVSETYVSPFIVTFTGVGGYIAEQIYLPEAFSIFMSALMIRFILGLLPGK